MKINNTVNSRKEVTEACKEIDEGRIREEKGGRERKLEERKRVRDRAESDRGRSSH